MLAVLLSCIVLQAPVRPAPDAEVVNSAMLSFFKVTKWNEWWTEGDYVVLTDKWAENERPSFDDSCRVFSVKLKPTKGGFRQAGAPLALKLLSLDRRILRGNQTYSSEGGKFGLWHPGALRVKNAQGFEGTVRVLGRLSPPTYSSDGTRSILRMSGVLWSMHMAEIHFLLGLHNGTWNVIRVQVTYFL